MKVEAGTETSEEVEEETPGSQGRGNSSDGGVSSLASSLASGEEDGEEESSGEEASGSSDEASEGDGKSRPRRRPRLNVAELPKRDMPNRVTRANRYVAGDVVGEDEEGDQEFWGQDFFAEEAADVAYETESEPEDRVDRDFDETEEEAGSDEDGVAAEAAAREPKRKALKPPGQQPSAPGARRPPSAASVPRSHARLAPSGPPAPRRGVRASTRATVECGEAERRRATDEARERRPARSGAPQRALTQAELLAEAARTEIENGRALAALEAAAAEVRAAGDMSRARYAGPMLRWSSRRVGDAEQTTLEVRNMTTPAELRPATAPPPPPRQRCAVSGAAARYRDPLSRAPYVDAAAFQALRAELAVASRQPEA